MVRSIYNRSVSFPIPNSSWRSPSSSSSSPLSKIKGRGSASLPVRFRHFVAPLQDHIHSLLTWKSCSNAPSTAWILDGTVHLDHLQESLDDLLQHPQAQDQLRRRSAWTDKMLDDFLRFADAYGSFRSAVIDLKDKIVVTRTAIYRHDGARVSSCLREQKKVEKEVLRIAGRVRRTGRWGLGEQVGEDEEELAAALKEVVLVMGMATAEVFGGVAAMAAAAVGGRREARRCMEDPGSTCMVGSILRRMGSMKKGVEEEEEEKWRSEKVEKLEKVEEFIGELEKSCERLFRSLVNSRVFLLNTLTPCI